MRVLAKDNSRDTERLVREMESRGYTLDSVETSGAFDSTAREVLLANKRERSSRRWRRFRSFLWALAWLVGFPMLCYFLT
jgi:hypothetical protein